MDKYTILVREGERRLWKQYLIIGDATVFVVHMEPAIFGWNIGRIDRQGATDWCGMTRDEIVAWKMRNNDGLTRIADDLGDFREKLIARAEGRQ